MRSSPTVPEAAIRGQTSLDFFIGIALFLLTLGFIVGMVPGLIDPFTATEENSLVADRIASEVAGGMLVEAGRPSILNESCTYAFFDESYGSGSACTLSFNETETDLSERLGVNDRYSINVSIQRDLGGGSGLEILCTDGTEVGPCGEFSPETRLAIGHTSSESRSVTATRRTAYIDGKDVTVVVRVW